MKQIKAGLVGYGYWGPNIARVLSENRDIELIACADLIDASLTSIKKKYPQIQTTKDYNDLLNNAEIDVIFVVTPTKTHYKIVKDALNAGKHVFVEKPITSSSKEAEELNSLAKKKKLILMVGHLFLYNSAVRYIRDLIKKGTLGKLQHLHFQRRNLGPIRRDVNVMWDLAPHDVSMLLYFVGETPVSVLASGQSFIYKDIQDVVSATIQFKNGVIANLILSWVDPIKIRDITIVGDKKMLLFDDVAMTEKIKLFDKNVKKIETKQGGTLGEFQLSIYSGDISIPTVQHKEPLVEEINHLVECIRSGKQPLTNGQNGVDVVKILEAIQKSLDENSKLQKL